jgi:hypothetical protein
MSPSLIDRSPDLSRLREEGYEVTVRDGHVVVTNVPDVDDQRVVRRGTIVVALTTTGDRTGPPPDHTVYFAGSKPCHHDGTPIDRIDAGSAHQQLAPGLEVDHRFSSKPIPAGRYEDYYDQISAYVRILSHEAQAIDAAATAATFAPVETTDEESAFYYLDSASSRAGIMMATAKLEQLGKIAIVGVGGTGSYVLDLVAKTPVGEIHIFDGDELLNHNAFRAPGALSLDELRERPLKVDHFVAVYGRMRRNVIPHPYGLDETNADELAGMDFVFVCMDGGPDKQAIVRALEVHDIPFIDVGMGIYEQDASLGGILRVTLSTPAHRNHDRIAFGGDDDANEYAQNIQIADLNAANAALAVIRWKRLFGFYHDFENEHHSTYTIDGNDLQNEDQP